jgi:hypothetical protein
MQNESFPKERLSHDMEVSPHSFGTAFSIKIPSFRDYDSCFKNWWLFEESPSLQLMIIAFDSYEVIKGIP